MEQIHVNRYRVYFGTNQYWLEDVKTGLEAGLGDGTDHFWAVQEWNERQAALGHFASLCEDMDSEVFCNQWAMELACDVELLDILFKREEA